MRRVVFNALLFFAAVGLPVGWGHEVSNVSMVAEIDTVARTYRLQAAMEVIPSADTELNDLISPEDAALTFAEDYLVLEIDEVEQDPTIEVTREAVSDEETPVELQREIVIADLAGDYPEGSSDLLVYIESACPMSVVMAVSRDKRTSRRVQLMLPGEYSRPISLVPVEAGDPFEKSTGVETAVAPSVEAPDSPDSSTADDSIAVEQSFGSALLSGWNATWKAGALLLALVLCTILSEKPIRHCLGELAAIFSSFSLALSLIAIGITSSPGWAVIPIALTVIALAGASFFSIKRQSWRYLVAGLGGWFGAPLLAESSAFSMLAGPENILSAGALIGFLGGVELAGLCLVGVAAILIYGVVRPPKVRAAFLNGLTVLVVGLAIFSLLEPRLF